MLSLCRRAALFVASVCALLATASAQAGTTVAVVRPPLHALAIDLGVGHGLVLAERAPLSLGMRFRTVLGNLPPEGFWGFATYTGAGFTYALTPRQAEPSAPKLQYPKGGNAQGLTARASAGVALYSATSWLPVCSAEMGVAGTAHRYYALDEAMCAPGGSFPFDISYEEVWTATPAFYVGLAIAPLRSKRTGLEFSVRLYAPLRETPERSSRSVQRSPNGLLALPGDIDRYAPAEVAVSWRWTMYRE